MQEKILIIGNDVEALGKNTNSLIEELCRNKGSSNIIVDICGALQQKNAKKFEPLSDIIVNPLDFIYKGYTDMREQADFLFAVIQALIKRPLIPKQRYRIEKIIHALYAPYINHLQTNGLCIDKEAIPTIADLHNALMTSRYLDIQNFAAIIEPYCKPGFIFCGHTNIDLSTHLNIFDMQEPKDNLLPISTLVLLHQIFIQIQENAEKQICTNLVLSSLNGELVRDWRNYLSFIYRKVRMIYGSTILSTSDIPFLTDTDTGRYILSWAEKIGIMRLSEVYYDRLEVMFGIDREKLYNLKDNDCLWLT